MDYNVAVDVGGTFTDVLVFDEETGELTEGKVLSTWSWSWPAALPILSPCPCDLEAGSCLAELYFPPWPARVGRPYRDSIPDLTRERPCTGPRRE